MRTWLGCRARALRQECVSSLLHWHVSGNDSVAHRMHERRPPRVVWRLTASGVQELATAELLGSSGARRELLVVIQRRSLADAQPPPPTFDPDAFNALASLGLIAPMEEMPHTRRSDAVDPANPPATARAAVERTTGSAAPVLAAGQVAGEQGAPLDYGMLAFAVRRLVAAELGLRGFALALALERAADLDELRAIAQRALEQIRARRGDPAAAAARPMLFGL